MYVLAFVFGFVYRAILKKCAQNTPHSSGKNIGKNIGKKDRIIRVVIGVALLVIAITTTWSPWLLFFSGFAFFEAISSWCGFYAALGKNTCPIT